MPSETPDSILKLQFIWDDSVELQQQKVEMQALESRQGMHMMRETTKTLAIRTQAVKKGENVAGLI